MPKVRNILQSFFYRNVRGGNFSLAEIDLHVGYALGIGCGVKTAFSPTGAALAFGYILIMQDAARHRLRGENCVFPLAAALAFHYICTKLKRFGNENCHLRGQHKKRQ